MLIAPGSLMLAGRVQGVLQVRVHPSSFILHHSLSERRVTATAYLFSLLTAEITEVFPDSEVSREKLIPKTDREV